MQCQCGNLSEARMIWYRDVYMDDKRDLMAAKISSYRGLPKLHEAKAQGLEETII